MIETLLYDFLLATFKPSLTVGLLPRLLLPTAFCLLLALAKRPRVK